MVEFSFYNEDYPSGTLESGLHIVATPIGNLSDISVRALKTLAGVHMIACEDSRKTGRLLQHFGIKTPMVSYHEHNARRTGPKIMSVLRQNMPVALVSDAGTPLVSDPGYRLVMNARNENIRVIPIPGPSAILAALVASGLQTDSFLFTGFLPPKKTARQKKLGELAGLPYTLVFFESPNRLSDSLADMKDQFGERRKGAICRELTKLHEEIIGGSLPELMMICENRRLRGEIVLILAPPESENVENTKELLMELLDSMPVSRAASEVARLTGKNRRELYQQALRLSGKWNDGYSVE